MFNLSAAEGPKWADICTEFTQKIQTLGPSPIFLALRRMRDKEKND
jgi:coenzyme F420-reducing hydrogenase delta subunit